MSDEPRIVEAVGRAVIDVKKLMRRGVENQFKQQITQVKLVRKDAAGNVLEEKTIKYGND